MNYKIELCVNICYKMYESGLLGLWAKKKGNMIMFETWSIVGGNKKCEQLLG